MKVYADSTARFVTQLTADVLLACWLILWIWVGSAVHDSTLRLAEPGDRAAASASDLSGSLGDAGAFLGDVPVVGDGVAGPFERAAAAADSLAAAGRAERAAVERLALWLSLAVAVVPISVVGLRYVPARVRWIREASAGRRLVDGPADLDLFALRALAHQPLAALARISDDPAGAVRRDDREVVARLAALELEAHGLSVPPRA